MSLTEITIYKLRDERTFNPMAILELLRQVVTTYGHVAQTKFKAYQEKEDSSKFYIIGGWMTLEQQKAFVASDLSTKLHHLLESTLTVEDTELVRCPSNSVTDAVQPICAIDRYTCVDDQVARAKLSLLGENSLCGGFLMGQDVYLTITGHKSVPKVVKSLETIDAELRKSIIDHQTRHIELNQFI